MKNLMGKGTKCLIVQSEFSKFSFWNYVDICKLVGAKYPAAPLGLMTVASLLPQQWEIKLVDANVEPLLDEHFEWADIVCTGGMLPQQKSMLSLIQKAHQHGLPAVVGGPDPTSQPNLYQSADYLVLGEGEITIPMFIQDLEKGCERGEYKSDEKADMTNAVLPRFDLIRFKDYLQVGVQFSRGCPFNCEFCDIIELYGRKPRTKTPEQLIKELQALCDLGYRGHIDFVDDNFIGNKGNVRKALPVIREWAELNNFPFYFSTEASVNLADDEPLMQAMKDADFRYVFLGIESPDDEILKLTNKKMNINKSITKIVGTINSYGMVVNAGFILGFDNESSGTSKSMIRCIQDSGISMAMLGKLYALPNTQLTRRLKREGRLFSDGSILSKDNTVIDQTSSGLNFIPTRPRLDILRDYVDVIKHIYDPKHYYARVVKTGLNLKPANKYKPTITERLKTMAAFLRLFKKVGFNKTTGLLYWKMIMTIILKNPKAFEASINLAAMYIHFHKQAKFIVDCTNIEIERIESCGEDKFNQLMVEKNRDSTANNTAWVDVTGKPNELSCLV